MELKEGSGINNLEGLTDKETALVGASMYLHFNSDEEIEALQMDDKEFEDFYDDGYDNAGGKPFALGRGRKRGRGRKIVTYFTTSVNRWCFSNRCVVNYFLDS